MDKVNLLFWQNIQQIFFHLFIEILSIPDTSLLLVETRPATELSRATNPVNLDKPPSPKSDPIVFALRDKLLLDGTGRGWVFLFPPTAMALLNSLFLVEGWSLLGMILGEDWFFNKSFLFEFMDTVFACCDQSKHFGLFGQEHSFCLWKCWFLRSGWRCLGFVS